MLCNYVNNVLLMYKYHNLTHFLVNYNECKHIIILLSWYKVQSTKHEKLKSYKI